MGTCDGQMAINAPLRNRVHHRQRPLLDIEWLLSTLFDASLFNFPSRRPPAAPFCGSSEGLEHELGSTASVD